MENHETNKEQLRVLSVQSHVVYGYVGNKSACFPLQLLGFEVDFINSVQFSNHTGYKSVTGQVLKAEELEELFNGLKSNQLLKCTHVLTGYVGNVTFLTKLVDILKEMKKLNPSLYIVCDPVMGDDGQLYVPSGVLPVYKDLLIPISDIITPNHFEAELLTGIKIKSRENVIEVMDALHKTGVKTVVLSSTELGSSENLFLYGSSILNDTKTMVTMEIPKLKKSFTGAGDLFSALLLAWLAKTDGDLKDSIEKTVNTLHSVLLRTLEYASQEDLLELKIIQSKSDIENPVIKFKCQVL